jgi:membrane protease YdiL (CAAX protease family)
VNIAAPDRPGWRQDGPRFALFAWLLATVALVAAGAVAAVVISVIAAVRASAGGERSIERLGKVAEDALGSEALAWATVIVTQLALLACAALACRLLGKPARERLGLVATDLRPMQGAVLLVATTVPFALGLLAASLVAKLVGSSDDDTLGLQRMWSEGSRGSSVAWILLIGLLPGFVEEVFYRGLLQRGLLLRWGPAASILTSSLLFAIGHGELAWAAATFPLGVWFGVVAWRTGSVLMNFVMHACLNGSWTAGMMILHRDPTSEPELNRIAIAALVLGLIALPWAIAILRRHPEARTSAVEPRRLSFVSRVAAAAVVAGALCFLVVPPGVAPTAPAPPATWSLPTLADLETSVVDQVTCAAPGERGAVEFALMPGEGARVALPQSRVGIDEVIVTLDAGGEKVWLAYAGEVTGKGGTGRPAGVVEQLVSGDPTVLCLTLAPGAPPVTVRLTLEEDEKMTAAAFERAEAEGWARRGRR